MKLSDLGLPVEEVNQIVTDLLADQQATQPGQVTPPGSTRPPEAPKPVPAPQPEVAITRVTDAKSPLAPVKTREMGTPLKTPVAPVGPTLPVAPVPAPGTVPQVRVTLPPPPAKKSNVGLTLAAAGTGFLVGGPVGALVGAGAALLLGGQKAAPAPAGPVKAPMPNPAQALPTPVVQVTPTSTKQTPQVTMPKLQIKSLR